MKILLINAFYDWGSTGKIAKDLHDVCNENGIECKSAYRYAEKGRIEDTILVSSWLDTHVHNRIARYTFMGGCFSHIRTALFIRKAKRYDPDVIHLHNLHGNYINLRMLFRYIKKSKARVVWTLHDCWSFTGYCPYFTLSGCERWKDGCRNCPDNNVYMQKCFDIIKRRWSQKRKYFTGMDKLEVVTPSKWLAELVRQSYLKEYNVSVIHNGIDLSVFRPTDSNFREKYGCVDKYIVLGVASVWEKRKGLDVFAGLAKILGDKYKIVIVGTDDEADKQLPDNVISIHRTNNQVELAEIYTAADVFVNPTREENYPTVNMEAIACGTPVVTFDTGGSSESLTEKSGIAVPCDDVDAMRNAIIDICEKNILKSADCIACAAEFDKKKIFREYIELYKRMYGN